MMLLLAVGPTLLPEFRDPNAGRIDVPSAALSVAAVLFVIFGIKRIAEDGLAAEHFIAIATGLALGAAFFRRQTRLPDPLIDVRLFRLPALSGALAINVAAIFITFGVFLFIAQYLQLVLGMGPFEAGLWTAPSGIVFALGSMAASSLVRSFKPHTVIAAGFLVSAVGFAMLTQLASAQSPWIMLIGMLVFCLGLAPVGAITTDLVIAAAPPERAGAASAISETSFEFGGALGIAVLGSVVAAIYRSQMASEALMGLPPEAVHMAKDTLGGAVAVAHELPGAAASQLLGSARRAFVYAFEVAAAISAAGAVLSAVLAAKILSGVARRP